MTEILNERNSPGKKIFVLSKSNLRGR